MLIDLPEIELNFSISNFNHFYTKVQSAFTLIQESENRAPSGAQGSPNTNQKIQAQWSKNVYYPQLLEQKLKSLLKIQNLKSHAYS